MTNAEKIVATIKELAYPSGTPKKKWAYKTGTPPKVYKAALKKYGKKIGRLSQSDCGHFANTVVRKSGVDKKFKSLGKVANKFPACSKKFKVVWEGKKVPESKLEPGDVIRYKSTKGQHVLFYMGNGRIAEAGRGIRFPIIRKSKKYNSSYVKFKTLQVLRVIESEEKE